MYAVSKKRKSRGYKSSKPPKKKARYGYSTVPRTKGVYAYGEMKYFDSVRENVAIGSSTTWASSVYDPNVFPVASMNCLFAPTVGAGINQRIGKACKVLKIKMNIVISIPAQTNNIVTDAGSYLRLLLVLDKQTNSAQMTGTQLMTSPGVATAVLAPGTYQNIDNFGRFKVLKDKHMTIDNPTITFDGTNLEQSGLIRRFKWNIKFKKPINVRFNNTNGGTVADIIDNSFHIVANNSSADLNPNISYNCRVCYKE